MKIVVIGAGPCRGCCCRREGQEHDEEMAEKIQQHAEAMAKKEAKDKISEERTLARALAGG